MYNQLVYALNKYKKAVLNIKPITKNILEPHLEDLELKFRPGLLTLTWESMKIEEFIDFILFEIYKFECFVKNVNGVIANRIEKSLKKVLKIILVKLPEGKHLISLEKFIKM